MQKIRQFSVNFGPILALLAGAVEGLLLARFVARLLAARPDNPAFQTLYALTKPLVAPLAALDSGQPPFGATLEFSTLTMAIVVPVLAYVAWLLLTRGATPAAGGPS